MTSHIEGSGSSWLLAGLIPLALFIGCTSGPSPQDSTWKLVPITDVGMVVGEWQGVVKKEHGTFPEGSVRLMIRPNNTYLFAGQTIANTAVGSGDLEARGGKLIGDTDRRVVTLTLYDHKGKAVIHVESTNHQTGERYHGEFTKVH
jgi:hypothetical protein